MTQQNISIQQPKHSWHTSIWVALFGLAFSLVEAAVVIYIRANYYPNGFHFPLQAIDRHIIYTELWREAATLIMLMAVGMLAGYNKASRFAYFLIGFAIWDIGYYVFLKLFIDWPVSILTWDVLFLIPITWFGPVLAPVLLSVLMLFVASSLLRFNFSLNAREWTLLIVASAACIVSFTLEYVTYLNSSSGLKDVVPLSLTYVPQEYPWWIFGVSTALILTALLSYWKRALQSV